MIATPEIRLATPADARDIALMSKHEVEAGLAWAWTEGRVRRAIHDRSTNGVVARYGQVLAGFALMQYDDDRAHLLLLAVNPQHRRRGIGRALIAWLERTLAVAGIRYAQVEVRAENRIARAFYAALGYEQVGATPGYYQGRETAIHLVKEIATGDV